MQCSKKVLAIPGVLVSGRGTRFILANTEQLHSKIQEMSNRIRSLEDALRALHSQHSANADEVHPLMRADLLGIKSTMGLYSGTQANGADSPSKPTSSETSRQMDLQYQSTTMERGSIQDTVVTTDHHSGPAQVNLSYYIEAIL
jgi:hypothetical protein